MSDPRARIATLRKVFTELVAAPDKSRVDELKDAGELMDDGYLDGAQYGTVYDLIEELKQLESPESSRAAKVRELAQRCLDTIFVSSRTEP